MQKKERAQILSQTKIEEGIYSMWLQTTEIAVLAKAGQFLSLYSKDGSRLLPRPISICEIDTDKKTVRLVYRVVGKGTEEFSKYQKGDFLDVLGPLGNGFTLQKKKALLIAGGIGIPPMVETAKQLSLLGAEVQVAVGYRSELFLIEELEKYAKVYIATEDGSTGTRGNVMDAIEENALQAEVIYACGPTPMLKAVQNYGESREIETQISLEEKMACGIGACLACVCQSKEKDEHTNVNNKRICKDGPVFDAKEVVL